MLLTKYKISILLSFKGLRFAVLLFYWHCVCFICNEMKNQTKPGSFKMKSKNNLYYCSESLNRKVQEILDDPTVHSFTKTVIETGLNKDSVDAINDVELALSILKEVENNLLS